jgi:transcriptional regulator with XRE-family HTH domain
MGEETEALGSPLVADGIGRRLRDRRIRMGLSVRQLAEAAAVDRASLARLEADDGGVRETTIGKVDKALARLEAEMGMDAPVGDVEKPIEFRVSMPNGADVVVSGSVRDLATLEQAVDRLLARWAIPKE